MPRSFDLVTLSHLSSAFSVLTLFPSRHAATAKAAEKDVLLNCQAAAALRERDPNVPIGGDALKDRKTLWATKKLP